jgi:competence protein ComEC
VLLRTVAPRLAVISCGVQNSFGFPSPAVLARYRDHGAEVARVDLLGAIGVRLDRHGGLRWEALAASVIP